MPNPMHPALPVPPALVYLLNQLEQAGIGFYLYGEVAEAEMVFVDIDRAVSGKCAPEQMPAGWSLISPHFISQRAVGQGEPDPITNSGSRAETIVMTYGAEEASRIEDFQALCEQVRYLQQQGPSRLIYHSLNPPEPMEIQAMIELLKSVRQY